MNQVTVAYYSTYILIVSTMCLPACGMCYRYRLLSAFKIFILFFPRKMTTTTIISGVYQRFLKFWLNLWASHGITGGLYY